MARTAQQESYGNDVAAPGRSNGLAVAALVCGIIGIFIAEFILGPLAIIFGAIGLHRANQGARGRGMALAGLILGIIDVVLILVLLLTAKHHSFSWHVG
jgi:hypothetical protein